MAGAGSRRLPADRRSDGGEGQAFAADRADGARRLRQQPVFDDKGDRLRAIANIGREDVVVEGLTRDPGVAVLGASSDHLVIDLTDAEPRLQWEASSASA